jgi:hypothetical protein
MGGISFPDYLTTKIISSEKPIQNIHPDISVSVPVAMQKDAARGLEDAVHFRNPLLEPRDIVVDAARPSVLKTADFPRVSPDDLVIPVAEKRRVKVDEVYALRLHAFKNFEVVAKDKFVYGHEAIGILPLAAREAKAAAAREALVPLLLSR